MKTVSIFLLVVVCAVWIVASKAPAQAPQTQRAGPVSQAEVHERGIAGVLGERLGKVITIHGTVVDGNTWHVKSAEGKTYLLVDRVDKRELKPVHVELAGGVKGQPAGSVVELLGYETGGFEGIVDDPRRPGFPPAGHGYGFFTHFVIWQQLSNH